MLTPNPYLKKLGLTENDRLVIFHADDIGMCQGSVSAYAALWEFGVLSSAAVMVPCPWFPAAVACYHQPHARQPDVGVHLTLTSEWSGFRWRPISTCDPNTGLLDADGYFHSRTPPVHAQADGAAVERELRAQVERARAAGLDLTHVDSHMLTLFHPRLLPYYFNVARENNLPAFMLRGDVAQWRARGYGAADAQALAQLTQVAEAQGMPLFDHFYFMSLDAHEARLEEAKQALAACPPGLTYFIIHPVTDTPELRAMAPDWRSRVADEALFLSDAWRTAIAESGVSVSGYRALRDAMRAGQ